MDKTCLISCVSLLNTSRDPKCLLKLTSHKEKCSDVKEEEEERVVVVEEEKGEGRRKRRRRRRRRRKGGGKKWRKGGEGRSSSRE